MRHIPAFIAALAILLACAFLWPILLIAVVGSLASIGRRPYNRRYVQSGGAWR